MTGETPRSLAVDEHLRPVRLAFLVAPNDTDVLGQVFQVNTSLWGGYYNPIVPLIDNASDAWEGNGHSRITATQIMQGYVDAFDPDYVIETRSGQIEQGHLKVRRFASMADVFRHSQLYPIGLGIDIRLAYDKFDDSKYADRIVPVTEDAEMRLFSSACFGEFPPDHKGYYPTREHCLRFRAHAEKLVAARVFDSYCAQTLYPIGVTQSGITLEGSVPPPVIFLLDAVQPLDLIDFWNLRCLGWHVIPVAVQWGDASLDLCLSTVRWWGRVDVFSHFGKLSPVLLKSRSTSAQFFQDFAQALATRVQERDPEDYSDSLTQMEWYPRLWDEHGRESDSAIPCELVADSRSWTVPLAQGEVSFESLSPPFSDNVPWGASATWANVVELRDFSGMVDVATFLPRGLKDVGRVLDPLSTMWTTSHGVVVICDTPRLRHDWRLPRSIEVLKCWVDRPAWKIEVSPNGRVAEQLVRSPGGVNGIGRLASVELIVKLNEVSKASQKTASWSEWKKTLAGTDPHRRRQWEPTLEFLVEHDVLKLGIRLKCPHCERHTWYALESLADHVRCEWCLQFFPFPCVIPAQSNKLWHFRVMGPFSITDYAGGAYTVAHSLRFFHRLHVMFTWVPSFVLRRPRKPELEVDFAVFLRESVAQNPRDYFVLAECKTFSQFSDHDFDRMEEMAALFPEAVLAFCTLRAHLDDGEKKRIRAIAGVNDSAAGTGVNRRLVLTLTATELLSALGAPRCWRQTGSTARELSQHRKAVSRVEDLCKLTQELYLGA